MDAPPPYPGGGGWQQPAAPPSYDESENMTKQGFPGPGSGGGFYTPGGGQFQGQGAGFQGHTPGEVERHYSSTQDLHPNVRRPGAGDGGVWRLGRGPSAGVGGDVQPPDWAVDTSTKHAWSDIDTDLDCTLTPHSPVPRRDHGVAAFGEHIYVVGGWNMEPYYSSTERFHLPTRTWSSGANMDSNVCMGVDLALVFFPFIISL